MRGAAMNEFIEQFLLESRELIAQATDDLLAIEEKPGDRERLDGAFRAFHTLKGAAGIVEFEAMARTIHAAEDILATVRSSEAAMAPSVLDECLACLDLTSRWLDIMETSGKTPVNAEADADGMIARLVGSSEGEERETRLRSNDDWQARIQSIAGQHFDGPRTAIRYVPDPDTFFRGKDPMAILAALPHLLAVDIALTNPAVSLGTMDPFRCSLDIVALVGASGADARAALKNVSGVEIRELSAPVISDVEDFQSKAISVIEAQVVVLREGHTDRVKGRLTSAGRTAVNALLYIGRNEPAREVEQATARAVTEGDAGPLIEAIEHALAAGAPERREGDTAAQVQAPRALRVDMNRIDALVKLTGELIVLKNAIGHAAKLSQEIKDPTVLTASLNEQHALFDRLAGELQTAVLRIRVLPLRSLFRRFPRLVREIAGGVGKTVRLITEGESTEADAAIVDALFEPMLHILRNAVDHGIESPERRAAAGKTAMGTVILRARRETDKVLIEIEDDGAGIDIARVRAVAAERGIVDARALAAMTETEVADLIFAPGFSTAAAVTGLSGRGVGMDSVKSAVESLGGSVVLQTRPGTGTIVALALPFSLMMTRVMTVEVAGQPFGLPLDTVLETTVVDRSLIHPVGAGRAFVLRNRTIALVDLSEMLGLPRESSSDGRAKIVVVSAGGQMAGIEVDRLGERLDVMLKPMDGLLAGMHRIAGTTLLGDGRVLIVLDPQEMFD
jgi:two-component system, chemotaxis family, sensor kinase CheA